MIERHVIASPIGALRLTARGGKLVRIEFDAPDAEASAEPRAGVLAQVCRQLQEYFAGTRREFALPLAAEGTDFQRAVWSALQEVPYGATASYGAIARRIGRPAAVRAVGLANGRNPIPIVVPCHRIIGSDGSLTGFGGGLHRKRWLLELEGVLPPEGGTVRPATSRAVRA